MPSVSVLIPAYNASAYVGEALESVSRQARLPDQIVLVDDASTDGTALAAEGAARKFGLKVEIVRQTINVGAAAARNVGLSYVRTTLVSFLDSDDVLLPSHLHLLSTAFDCRPDLVGCFGDQEVFDDTGIVRPSFLRGKPIQQLHYDLDKNGLRILRVPLFSSLVFGNYVPTSGCVLSLARLRQIGGFNAHLSTSEDREALARLSLLGPFAYYPSLVARKREHHRSLTAHDTVAIRRNAVDALLALKASRLSLTTDQRASLDAALENALRDLLYRASCDGVKAYLATRRWIASFGNAPLHWNDAARAVLRTLAPH